MKLLRISLPAALLILIFCCAGFTGSSDPDKPSDKAITSWNEELNGLNYLVMRTSSINLVNGLYLSRDQAAALYKLSLQMEALDIEFPDNRELYSDDLTGISATYFTLIDVLLKGMKVSDSLKNGVNNMRITEADFIKRSILAAEMPAYSGKGCLECHAPPALFPKGSIASRDTKPITGSYRKEIDLAHIRGLFGDEGTARLWELKEAVDSILTNEQKYVFSSFRCCLIPPENSGDPGIIGQSFVTNEWIDYFNNIRSLTEKQWLDYKDLYLIPLRDILKAKLPGIKKRDMETRIAAAEQLIASARKMDKIDFELQKENLCIELSNALSIDDLNGESGRMADDRKFMAAMFLLFPGTTGLYLKMSGN